MYLRSNLIPSMDRTSGTQTTHMQAPGRHTYHKHSSASQQNHRLMVSKYELLEQPYDCRMSTCSLKNNKHSKFWQWTYTHSYQVSKHHRRENVIPSLSVRFHSSSFDLGIKNISKLAVIVTQLSCSIDLPSDWHSKHISLQLNWLAQNGMHVLLVLIRNCGKGQWH